MIQIMEYRKVLTCEDLIQLQRAMTFHSYNNLSDKRLRCFIHTFSRIDNEIKWFTEQAFKELDRNLDNYGRNFSRVRNTSVY